MKNSTATSPATAFVLAGGGSFGAVQAGMLRELVAAGIVPDFVVGSSVGAINGAYFAGSPTAQGVAQLEAIWRGLRRQDVFPFTLRSLAGLIGRRDFIVDPCGLRRLLEDNLPIAVLEQAKLPLHVVATDLLSGAAARLSSGSAVDAVLASCAIPGAFPPMRIGERHLIDGAVASNTPIRAAMELGASRIIVLPTGFACAMQSPPRGAIATMLHAVTLLVAHQLVTELERYGEQVEIVTVPPLCPLSVSPYDFSRARELIERAAAQTRRWLRQGGMEKQRIPAALRPHEDRAGGNAMDQEEFSPSIRKLLSTSGGGSQREIEHAVGNALQRKAPAGDASLPARITPEISRPTQLPKEMRTWRFE